MSQLKYVICQMRGGEKTYYVDLHKKARADINLNEWLKYGKYCYTNEEIIKSEEEIIEKIKKIKVEKKKRKKK